MQNILVIGSTGMIGTPVTKELMAAGLPVTLLVRNKLKVQTIFPGARLVEGDVFDPLSLLKAFEGQEALYLNLSPPHSARKNNRMPEREGIENIISVAKEAGIKRIAFLSSLVQNYNNTNGFHWWIFDMKQQAVEKIKSSGIPYTIFYASSFMENFDKLLLKGNRLMLAGRSKAPMYFIAGKDYGKQVAKSFSLLTTESKEYIIQGTDAYTWDEGAKIFINNYQKAKLKIMKAPLGMMKFMGAFVPFASYTAHILEALNNYPEKFAGEATWEELGKPATGLKEYTTGL